MAISLKFKALKADIVIFKYSNFQIFKLKDYATMAK
jgi:hypothetical protein